MKPTAQYFSIPRHRQTGMALITGLIFMVVLTLLALAAMRTTTLEERMSGNARDRDLAFQAAEAALRAGEQAVSGATTPAFALGTAYTPRIAAGTLSTYWPTHPWATQSIVVGCNSAAVCGTAWQPAGTSAAPRFVIEEMPATACAGGSLAVGPTPECGVYRVTARGVGRSANTMVILQAVYQR
jgi:type IV pilus assembly protein PilX